MADPTHAESLDETQAALLALVECVEEINTLLIGALIGALIVLASLL